MIVVSQRVVAGLRCVRPGKPSSTSDDYGPLNRDTAECMLARFGNVLPPLEGSFGDTPVCRYHSVND